MSKLHSTLLINYNLCSQFLNNLKRILYCKGTFISVNLSTSKGREFPTPVSILPSFSLPENWYQWDGIWYFFLHLSHSCDIMHRITEGSIWWEKEGKRERLGIISNGRQARVVVWATGEIWLAPRHSAHPTRPLSAPSGGESVELTTCPGNLGQESVGP